MRSQFRPKNRRCCRRLGGDQVLLTHHFISHFIHRGEEREKLATTGERMQHSFGCGIILATHVDLKRDNRLDRDGATNSQKCELSLHKTQRVQPPPWCTIDFDEKRWISGFFSFYGAAATTQ
jgi:hypothetical protein